MSGNVLEWVWDRYGYYSTEPVTDPTGPSSGTARVFRDGGWGGSALLCHVAYRYRYNPRSSYADLGFRVAASVWK